MNTRKRSRNNGVRKPNANMNNPNPTKKAKLNYPINIRIIPGVGAQNPVGNSMRTKTRRIIPQINQLSNNDKELNYRISHEVGLASHAHDNLSDMIQYVKDKGRRENWSIRLIQKVIFRLVRLYKNS